MSSLSFQSKFSIIIHFSNRWKIHAKVDFIYPKKTYVNDQGTGEIFSCDLTDETGSITFVGFNSSALMLAEKIHLNKVVIISKETIKRKAILDL